MGLCQELGLKTSKVKLPALTFGMSFGYNRGPIFSQEAAEKLGFEARGGRLQGAFNCLNEATRSTIQEAAGDIDSIVKDLSHAKLKVSEERGPITVVLEKPVK